MGRKLIALVLVGVLCFALAGTASAAGRGGFHHGGFHHGGGHRFGCCFGPAIVGGLFLGAALATPFYAYSYPYAYPYAYSHPPYPAYSAPVYAPAPSYAPQVSAAPSVQREVCYTGGCYRLQGDGVTVAYQWVWYPAVPPPPPGPPRS
jgi:hypothetical protein